MGILFVHCSEDSELGYEHEEADVNATRTPKWFYETSLNNLRDVHALYCPEEERYTKSRL